MLKFSGFQGQAKSLPEATEKNLIIEYKAQGGTGCIGGSRRKDLVSGVEDSEDLGDIFQVLISRFKDIPNSGLGNGRGGR